MKIIVDDAAYIQKHDLTFLNKYEVQIPASILIRLTSDDITLMNDSEKFEFVKFDSSSEINFFQNVDWIINYDDVKNLSEKEIIELCQSIEKEKKLLLKQFNLTTNHEVKNISEIYNRCELMDFKIYSLRNILFFKQGYIEMQLPTNYNAQQRKTIQKHIKSIFQKRKR